MEYSLKLMLSPLVGGIGVIGRFVVAITVLMLLKYLDKNNTEIDKGIKKLLTGRLITAALFVLGVVLMAGLYFAGVTIPFWYIFN